MRARVRERNHAVLVSQQFPDTFVAYIEEFADERISWALQAIHAAQERPWPVAGLACVAGLSSFFDSPIDFFWITRRLGI